MIRDRAVYRCVFLLSFFFTGFVYADTIEKTFQVKPGGIVFLESDVGSITLESHQHNKVDIEVRMDESSKENFKVAFSTSGNDVKITGQYKKRQVFSRTKIHYTIKVPTHYNANLQTGGGSIEVSDLNGNLDARTSGGSIRLGRIIGEANINTSGGSINVNEIAGTLNAKTSGGSIQAIISKQPDADSHLITSGGSITVSLADSIAVDLDARTSGGRVRSDFAVNGLVEKNHIKGAINGGGPKLELKTSGGSVRIKSL